MAGNFEGAQKAAAARIGCSVDEYAARLAAGDRWCWGCGWRPESAFGTDSSKPDGVARVCRFCKNARARELHRPGARTAREKRRKAKQC